jgi:hypothetical protein
LQILPFPCGTCGRLTSHGNCAVTLTCLHGGTFKISSTCPDFSGITYASALKGSKTMPCTYVPVICELCVQPNNSSTIPGIWRYNLKEHIKALRPGHTQSSQFSQKLLRLLIIDANEQLAMGIPQEQIPPITTPRSPVGSHGVKCSATDQILSPRSSKLAHFA